ncbi:MAG: hypothetical protein ACI306_01370 [Muribaculaceae bacterium]
MPPITPHPTTHHLTAPTAPTECSECSERSEPAIAPRRQAAATKSRR